jgi:HK97 family phage major capsid protein
MKDVQKMKRERQALIDEMRSITSAAETRSDKRMTEQEAARWQELNAHVEAQGEEIKRAERMNTLEMETSGHQDGSEDRDENSDTDKPFSSFGDFLQAVRSSSAPGAAIDSRLLTRAASGMNETSPGDGGFLVQTDQVAGIMKRAYDRALIAGRCRRTGIGANANGLAWYEVNETSRATGSRWGGIRGYWSSEAATVSSSKTAFVKKRLDLEKLLAFVYVTEELLQDTAGMDSLISEIVGNEFAWMLDDAIVNGTGAGKPLGWLNSDAVISVAKRTGQAAKTVVYENIVDMWSRLWAQSRGNSVWYINQDVEPQLNTMAMVVGTGGVPVYLPAGGLSSSPYGSLFGRQVITIEQAATCGTVGDINLVDPSQYLIIDKNGVRKDVSMHVRFLYDEQVFRFTMRVNGMPTWNSALTPANGTLTVSPFVTLAARA